MIIKGGSRSNRRFFAKHLLNAKDNERVRVVEFKGFAREDVGAAFKDMEAAAKGTRCENYFYHADMNPRGDEHLTAEQWDGAVDTLERHLGLEGQARFVIEHEKDGRIHRHVVWSRIDPDTMTARSDSLTYAKHEAAAREIERDCGLEAVPSVLVKDRGGPRPERRAKDYEGFRAVKTGLNPDDVTRRVTALWQESDSSAAFHAALTENGYILCKGDRRDFCIVDPAGDEHSLARRISGANAAAIRERMKDLDRDSLPTVAEAREMATAWGGSDSEAARDVRLKELEDTVKGFRGRLPYEDNFEESREEYKKRMERNGVTFEPGESTLQEAARQYGKGVKEVARAGQDMYWQATIGGKPRTEADKLHDLMWGEGPEEKKRDGPEWER
jgi:Relaxase/Mobilisation nuclease domain